MFTLRPTKRDKTNRFSMDMLFEVFADDRPIGPFVFVKKSLTATLTLEGKTYTVAHDRSQDIDRLGSALIRAVTGGEKPRAHPWVLKDGEGRTLALGQLAGKEFAVRRGEAGFFLRKVGRPYHLYRQGSDQSLGSVGQEKFFTTTLQMRLPADEFDAAFQVFLLTLVLGLTMIQLESSSS
jgi:hypothetical protein